MKDMDKAVARISKALENGEKLAVFGDYDVDGITSTCLLTDYLRSRGADVTMHIPRRIEEGYGLGCDAIRALSESGVTLIVTVDCGITGVDETAYAATLGVDLVITDHHECKEQLPAAVAVVDPHRPDCPYPFKHLAGVGVALKLVLALARGARMRCLRATARLPPSARSPTSCAWRARTAPSSNAVLRASTAATSRAFTRCCARPA